MRKMQQTRMVVFFLLLFIGGMFILFSLVFSAHEKRLRDRCTVDTTGLVVDLEWRWSHDVHSHHRVYYPVISYNVHGEEFVETSSFGTNPPIYDVGDEIALSYNPENPHEFYMEGDSVSLILCTIFFVIGSALLLLDVVFVVYRLRGLI